MLCGREWNDLTAFAGCVEGSLPGFDVEAWHKEGGLGLLLALVGYCGLGALLRRRRRA